MDPAQLQPISARRVSDLSHFAVMEMTRTYEQEQAQLQAELERIMRDDGRDTSNLSMLIQRQQNHSQQLPKPQLSPVKIPRLDLSLVFSGAATGTSSSSFSSCAKAGGAAWETIVTDRTTRQTFLAMNSSLSPRHLPSSARTQSSNNDITSPSTRIFDLTQPRKVPVPPSASASSEQSPSPLAGSSARKLLRPPVLRAHQSPRRQPIAVEGNGSADSSNIAELHKESEQRLLHVILTQGVLSQEIRKSGFATGDVTAGVSLSDVNRLAKRMFPSLHPSISSASVAPVMCGIPDDMIKKEDVAAVLLAMVYSSFVADLMGKSEFVTKEALLQCICRLNISQSATPETCDGLRASALADRPGVHSCELFCLWFVKMHMTMILGQIMETKLLPGPSLPAHGYRQEILYMLRLHSNSAISHLRAVNKCLKGNSNEQRKKKNSGRAAVRDGSCSPPQRPMTAASSSSLNVDSKPSAAAEAERKSTTVNSARTCISANMHLVRLAQEQGVLKCKGATENEKNHVRENVAVIQQGALCPASSKARAFYRSIAAIDQRISTLHRAQQQQLDRTCTIAHALMVKSDKKGTRRIEHSKASSGIQMLLLSVAAAAVRIAVMAKRMQKERLFLALSKNSAAWRLCRFLKSIKGVMDVKRRAHFRRQQALFRRCASTIVMFFKLYLPRMKRLRREKAVAVIAESLREQHRGWGSSSVRVAMSQFLKKVRIVQKQARLFLSRAAANKRWLLWQFRNIEKMELLRVYGKSSGKGTLTPSDMSRLMMAHDVRQSAIDQLWKVLRRNFSDEYTMYQMERKKHFIRLQEMAVFRRGMLSYVGLNHAAMSRLPDDVRYDLLTAYNPPVPPSYKDCMRPSNDELLQVVRMAQWDSGRPLDATARRGVSAYAKQRRRKNHSSHGVSISL